MSQNEFARGVFQRWGRYACGVLSVLLAIGLAIQEGWKDANWFRVSLWTFSYVCLVFAAYSFWRDVHLELMTAKERLTMRGLTEANRREALKQLANLTSGDREGLRVLLVKKRMSGEQVRDLTPAPDFIKVKRDTTFLHLDLELVDIGGRKIDIWTINPEWRDVLGELLIPPEPEPELNEEPPLLIWLHKYFVPDRVIEAVCYGFWYGWTAARTGKSWKASPSQPPAEGITPPRTTSATDPPPRQGNR